ncbi:MAG: UTP--glucose-1-phosphate uridylyltransferase [Akkermansiaceae bacterium]|jgi:UTP--glucose-1-phosphate uridylyltransferase
MTETAERIRQKMADKGVMNSATLAFLRAYQLIASGSKGEVPEEEIGPSRSVVNYESLKAVSEFEADLLAKTVVIKLNGGLGTSMGLEKVKSLLEVRPGVAFLDLMARQILSLRAATRGDVRFLLMNSNASSDDTLDYLRKSVPELGDPADLELLQNWVPKLEQETLEAVSHPANPDLEWCPPGHADVYPSLEGSGWLDRLLEDDVKYAFISNSDNLGAVLDPTLLSYFAHGEAPFLMEVTRRTESDKKGGHLATRKSDERLLLRELAQCPEADLESFQDINRHQFFNTNNIWVNLKKLKQVMAKTGGVLELPVIRNGKTVDPRDSSTTPVYQLEQAMGSAIECFEGSAAVNVPRSRFAPVKGTSDLFALRSDAYEVGDDGRVQLVASRGGKPPVVRFSSEYKLVDALAGLGQPSLLEAEELSVSGPVTFAEGVVIKGKVAVINASDETKIIPSGLYTDQVITL